MPNFIQPYAKLIVLNGVREPNRLTGIRALQCIENIGRVSHRSEDSQTDESWERFIKAVVMGHGDWSIVEHVTATVEFYVDRGITHEIVRHRLFSYTQESTRFVNYEKKMRPNFVIPPGLDEFALANFTTAISLAEDYYKNLIDGGCAPQIARSVFPNALASKLIMTGNLRNWRHFFIMRTSKETHPQCREVTIPLLQEFVDTVPLLFDDIEPLNRQIDNLKLPR